MLLLINKHLYKLCIISVCVHVIVNKHQQFTVNRQVEGNISMVLIVTTYMYNLATVATKKANKLELKL